MRYLLGVDLATSGVTAMLVEPGVGALGRTFVAYPQSTPRTGWAEQQPEDWWDAAQAAIRRLLCETHVAGEAIAAIGLSGQMHGLVLVDAAGEVVRPAIIWRDQRGLAQVEWMLGRASEREWMTWTATPPRVGTMGARLLWVKQREPEHFARAATMLAPKDFIRLRLTGACATDVTDASSTLLFDVPARTWSAESQALMDIDAALLPEVLESQEVSGTVTPDAAVATGLRAGTPVVAGAGNQAAAAMGLGVIRSKEVAAIMGSGGVVLASMNEPLIDRDLRLQTCCHARRTKWNLVGLIQSAGSAFRWMRDTFCAAEREVASGTWDDVYYLMTRQAEHVPIGSDGLLFLPYLAGERSPHYDLDARGVFYGCTAGHDRPHFIRAVMEGVAFSMRDCLEVVKATGINVDRVVMSGGGMQSHLWRQIFADVFGYDIIRTNVQDPAPFGAALMAGVAAGFYASVEGAAESMVQAIDIVAPGSAGVEAYDAHYALFRDLYPALAPLFTRTAAAVAAQAARAPAPFVCP